MKHSLLALMMLASLGGCATFGTVPEEVKIPIAVACKTEDPNVPTFRFNPPYDNIFDATRDLMGDREVALAYENELRAALKSCK
jgi:hypothetical protein